jgi:tetratricopeptide (TPR) repeat protein
MEESAKNISSKFNIKDILICLGIFLFAFFLRLIYVYQYQDNPFFDSPVIDALTNYLFAVRGAEGDWLVKGEVVGRGPVYVYFLAFLFKLFGTGFMKARIAQMALGSVNCILLYFLGKKIFSRSVGIISALICSAYGVLIYFDAEFLYVGLAIFLNLLLIICLLNALEKPKLWKWVGCGVLLGLSLQTNATIMLFIPLVFAWLFFSVEPAENENSADDKPLFVSNKKRFKKALGIYLLIVLGLGLVMLPFTLRNYFMGGDLVMVGTAAGINLHIGNNPNADGKSVNVPTRDFSYSNQWYDNTLIAAQKGAERQLGRELLPSEASNYWIKKSLGFIITHPGTTLYLMFRKFFYFFNAYEIPENQSIYFFRIWSPLLKILVFNNFLLVFPFGIICPLALLGIMVTVKKKNKEVLLLLTFIAAFLFLMMIFFVCSRYRAIAVPVFIIFAAVAVDWYIRMLKQRDFKTALRSLMPLFCFYLFSNAAIFEAREDDDSRWFLNLGTAYRYKEEDAKAIKSYQAAKKVNPRNPDSYYNLGVIYLEKGEYDKAIEEFQGSIKLDEHDSAAYSNIGIALFRQNKIGQAIASFEKALNIDPADVGVSVNLAAAYIQKGDFIKAEQVLDQALKRAPDFAPIHFHLGILFENTGKLNLAEKGYLKAAELRPEYFQAYFSLYKLYEKTGQPDKADKFKKKALGEFSQEIK